MTTKTAWIIEEGEGVEGERVWRPISRQYDTKAQAMAFMYSCDPAMRVRVREVEVNA